ncbi:MAG TPA: 30S ribosomal protein S15 [Candidatus Kapabacteria bacterium]|nr:30S ribosomal protein S15 [Candidatus Kapabacteria bacterium]HPO63652.1 30S ribosomal protein S15 [Candidatus Kapabacteria bacterium]
MMITKETKKELVERFTNGSTDTGKPEVQVAIFTTRINDLTKHLESHKKDHHTRRGLIQLVNKRRKLLDYLAKKDITRYRKVISDLSLRK